MVVNRKFRGSGRFVICCLLAMLLHIPLLFWPGPHRGTAPHPIAAPARIVHYTLPKPRLPLPTLPKQVVHLPKPAVAKRPQQADFVSEWDNTAAKQTRSARPSTKPAHTSSSRHQARKERAPTQRRITKQKGNIAVARDNHSDLLATLFPSQQQLQRDMHLDFADALPHKIPVAANTQLNTLRWRHATFFNRMKEQVAQAWHPARQLGRYNPEGLGLNGTRATTSVLVTMNRKGELIRVVILQSSGFAYLDEAARAAFWQAQPFLRPPAALFAQQQQVSFRFSFVVSLQPTHLGKVGSRALLQPLVGA